MFLREQEWRRRAPFRLVGGLLRRLLLAIRGIFHDARQEPISLDPGIPKLAGELIAQPRLERAQQSIADIGIMNGLNTILHMPLGQGLRKYLAGIPFLALPSLLLTSSIHF